MRATLWSRYVGSLKYTIPTFAGAGGLLNGFTTDAALFMLDDRARTDLAISAGVIGAIGGTGLAITWPVLVPMLPLAMLGMAVQE